MSKMNNVLGKLLGRKKDVDGSMTITITNDGVSGSGTGTGAASARLKSIPWLGTLAPKVQYSIVGGVLLVSLLAGGGLIAWGNKNKEFYGRHLDSALVLKKSLADLQADSYRVATGLDTFAPMAYLDLRDVNDTFIAMKSDVFEDEPALTGVGRSELDRAYTEWSRLKGELAALSKLHVEVLTVRGKFAGGLKPVNDAVAMLKELLSKNEAASAETVEAARNLMAALQRVQVRLGNSDANVSFRESAKEMDEFLGQADAMTQKFSVDGIRDEELKKKAADAQKFLKEYLPSAKKFNALLLNVADSRQNAMNVSNGASRVLQQMEYVTTAVNERIELVGKMNYVVGVLGLLALISLSLLAWINSVESQKRTFEVKDENEANQKAIMSLLDEIANLADGDLTVRATVNEQITGAIADSMNFAIGELNSLVAQIQKASGEISEASGAAFKNSKRMLDITNQQASDIKETGASVLNITSSIEDVSKRVEDSKKVAEASVATSERGMKAVTASIEGIRSIQVNVEETGKRIKRLTEQSKQISQIVDLIADISERTSVLAINATVQATKAGTAGKGFKVVADEVQDLANQAADATRRIGALINAIQTDIQGAGVAMDKTTEEATKGAGLAETTGEALSEINDVSMALADIVAEINEKVSTSASAAADVSLTMKKVLASVGDASESAKATGSAIDDIAKLSERLKDSVSGFKV